MQAGSTKAPVILTLPVQRLPRRQRHLLTEMGDGQLLSSPVGRGGGRQQYLFAFAAVQRLARRFYSVKHPPIVAVLLNLPKATGRWGSTLDISLTPAIAR